MSAAEDRLAQLRAVRDAARDELVARVDAARDLTKPKALGKRLRADMEHHGRHALAQAMEIAADNRGVLAGTLTVLMLWFAKKPIGIKALELAPKALPLLGKARGLAGTLLSRVREMIARDKGGKEAESQRLD